MFPIFAGMSLGWLLDMFKKQDEGGFNLGSFGGIQTPSLNYAGYKVNERMLDVIAINEEGGILKTSAYWDTFGKAYTIGYGTVTIYNDSSKMVGRVQGGDTLQKIKSRYGISGNTDYQIARQLQKNHLNRIDGVKKLFAVMDARLITYNKGLAEALCDFLYNSGGPLSMRVTLYNDFINDCVKISSSGYTLNKDILFAKAYLKWRLRYLYQNKIYSNSSNWRRTIAMANRIIGIDEDDRTIQKKYPGVSGNYNRLIKPYAVQKFGVVVDSPNPISL